MKGSIPTGSVDRSRYAQDGDADSGVLRALIDRLPAMVAYWDSDLRNVVANLAYVEWFGLTPEQMCGMHIRDLLGEELFARNLPFIEAVLGGEEQLFDRTLIDTHGRERHTQASYVPDVVDGVVSGFFVLVTDVTPRVKAERELRRSVEQYRALARSMPSSFVLVFDENLRFTVADGPALSRFGQSRASMEGRTVWEVLPDRVADLVPRYRAALEGQTTTWDRTTDGRVVSLTAAPVRAGDGSIFAGMVVGTDVTEERRREATDRALRSIAARVADGATPEAILELATTAVLELFATDRAGVVHFDQGGKPWLLASVPDLATLTAEHFDSDADDTSAVARVARTGKPQLAFYHDDPSATARALSSAGIAAAAAAPIFIGGRMWGAISLDLRDPDRVGDDTLERLAEFAEIVALSVSSAEAWQTLTHLATIDPLTSLPNRRTFDENLRLAIRFSARQGKPMSVAIIDLDHFKTINDIHGHPTGDRVLREAAARMASVTRSHETLARIGGEEFGVILPETDAVTAARAIDRMRTTVSDHTIAGIRVTASAGVYGTTLSTTDEPDRLLSLADDALYAAKTGGRNRTNINTTGTTQRRP